MNKIDLSRYCYGFKNDLGAYIERKRGWSRNQDLDSKRQPLPKGWGSGFRFILSDCLDADRLCRRLGLAEFHGVAVGILGYSALGQVLAGLRIQPFEVAFG